MITIIFLVLLLIVIIGILSSIKIVNTGYVLLVERFGQFHRILEPGWHLTIVFADFVRRKISTKQQILDIQPQNVITKDNVNISIDNVIFYKVTNSRDAVYNIEDYNSRLLEIIDEITDAYGIKILSVEIKNIVPPGEIQQAMEKQMRAERDKRAVILTAEGEKQSLIEKAEGHKQAQILNAEAEKQATIRRAEGLKESQLLEAEGKARAIETIAIAEAGAIRKVNTAIIESGTNETVIALKQIEALKEMAKNPANKLILPNETLSSFGSIAAIAEMLKMSKNNESKLIPNKSIPNKSI